MSKNKFNNHYSNLESSEQTKKYVKEMYEMADKTEHRSTLAFAAIAAPIAIIFALTLVQMVSFTVNLAKGNANSREIQVVSNNTASSKDGSANQNETATSDNSTSSVAGELNDKIYTYLKDSKNRTASLEKATKLNKGSDKGLSTIFVAQILRDNGYDINNSVINTSRLVDELEKAGWEKVSDYNQLKPGDICFTSDSKSGAPSHTYIFMDWVEEGKTDYANIVDNQVSEYNDTYHKRNIDSATTKKDKFNFFMRKK